MRCGFAALAVVAAVVMGGPAEAKDFLFDMGTATSELRPGFIRITAKSVYSKETGYGWKSAEGLKEHYKHYGREWEYNESRGQKQPPPIYTNEITCDCVWSTKPNTLLVDVPPGEYTVWLLCGRSAGSSREYHDFDVSAGSAGAGKGTVKIPGPYRFEKRLLRVEAGGGQL